MSGQADPQAFEAPMAGGGIIRGEWRGEGSPIVLLHGLTATRRYVVQGSTLLARGGHRLISYDARGHGSSDPAPQRSAYDYADLVADLAAVLEARQLSRPVLAGVSMGAATAASFALEHPGDVSALVLITPAAAQAPAPDSAELEVWDARADAMARGDLAAFVELTGVGDLPEGLREPARTATRQRAERHLHPAAVADALRRVPRSSAFGEVAALSRLDLPVLVVASRDAADPGHPFSVAKAYAEAIPHAELVVEDEGKAPLAWQGAQLSRTIAGFLGSAQP